MPSKFLVVPPATALAPGDQVVRYVNGKPLYCTVVTVIKDSQLLIKAEAWPTGYSAPVGMRDVMLVARLSQFGTFA
jgi:hypothetical protein